MKHFFASIKKQITVLDTSEKQLVSFGFIIGGILLLAAGFCYWREYVTAMYVLGIPGFILFFFGAWAPRVLRLPYLAWMTLGIVLGGVVGTVILSVLYLILVTPIALLVNIFKGSPLVHKTKEGSYWIPRTTPMQSSDMEHLF